MVVACVALLLMIYFAQFVASEIKRKGNVIYHSVIKQTIFFRLCFRSEKKWKKKMEKNPNNFWQFDTLVDGKMTSITPISASRAAQMIDSVWFFDRR